MVSVLTVCMNICAHFDSTVSGTLNISLFTWPNIHISLQCVSLYLVMHVSPTCFLLCLSLYTLPSPVVFPGPPPPTPVGLVPLPLVGRGGGERGSSLPPPGGCSGPASRGREAAL